MIELEVHPDGAASYVVVAEARDVLVWERTGRDRSFGGLMEGVKMADLYELAYLAARRTGATQVDRATFDATCNVMPHGEEQTDADPTQKAL